MKKLSLLLLVFTCLAAQEESIAPDTMDTPPSEDNYSTISLGLDYGYKGFPWGSLTGSFPETPLILLDSTEMGMAQYAGYLGTDSVTVSYFFADSGFWKVEIDFIVNQNNIDDQIKMFSRLEQNISEVYGPPKNTHKSEGGSGPTYNNMIHPKFSKAFYRSTWGSIPVKIELLLIGYVLVPKSDLPIFSGDFSQLKLVYYNPDYMTITSEAVTEEPLPSVFDIY